MNISRRSFLATLGASIAAPALPAHSLGPLGRVEIIGQKIVLSKPLDLSHCSNFLIKDCDFSAAADFEGDGFLICGPSGTIEGCTFWIPREIVLATGQEGSAP